jgi:hypothetical protein
MSRQSEVIRLWRRRIRKADIARLTLFSVGEVNQIIDSQKQIDAIKRKTQPPETCETAKNKYDWLPADDEANTEGVRYLPTPELILHLTKRIRAGELVIEGRSGLVR